MRPGDSKEKKNDWPRAIRDGMLGAWPIYAGSSQFIAVSMLSAGAGFFAIVITTFTVNLRHLLMSSSLSTYVRGLGHGWLSVFAYGVTDESFALNVANFRERDWDWRRALVLNQTSNLAWIVSTVAGGYGGQFIPAGAFGIDYALVAMFICLLIFQIRGSFYVLIALISGLAAILLSLIVPGNAYIFIASTAAATLGVILKRFGLFRKMEGES
jgi:4-azaleucine resistance transporter AzlC